MDKKRVAIVTGAGRMIGIGRAVSLKLAGMGYAVAVAARRSSGQGNPGETAAGWRGADSVADEIKARGGRAIAAMCDVTQSADVEALVEQTLSAFGGVTALVNNAAIGSSAKLAPIIDLAEDGWNEMIEVNLTGMFRVSKAVARAMAAANEGGAIVNVSSLAGRSGMANFGAYCATKAGVIAFTQQLALELAPRGIRVNCVCPGATDTDMLGAVTRRAAERKGQDAGAQIRARIAATIPLGRIGAPEEQANAIAFLVSEEASYITGQTLNVDGGQRMD